MDFFYLEKKNEGRILRTTKMSSCQFPWAKVDHLRQKIKIKKDNEDRQAYHIQKSLLTSPSLYIIYYNIIKDEQLRFHTFPCFPSFILLPSLSSTYFLSFCLKKSLLDIIGRDLFIIIIIIIRFLIASSEY